MLGFFYRANPPTGAVSAKFPAVIALLEKKSQKRSTCGSILRKASQTVTKTSNVQHPHRIEVLQLQTPLVEEPAQEPVRGVS